MGKYWVVGHFELRRECADLRAVIKLSLELTVGWQVVTATSGVEGLRKAADQDPDAILLDVMMPGLDGLATLDRLRTGAVTREVPVIFLTARALVPESRRLTQLGVAGVIAKPFDPETFGSEVATMLGWDVEASAS